MNGREPNGTAVRPIERKFIVRMDSQTVATAVQSAGEQVARHLRSGDAFTLLIHDPSAPEAEQTFGYEVAAIEPVPAVESATMRELLHRFVMMAKRGVLQCPEQFGPVLQQTVDEAMAAVQRKPLIVLAR